MKSCMLFIAASPLQLLNCIEAAAYFKPAKTILLLALTKSEKNTMLLFNLLKMYPWQEIKYITLPSSKVERFFYAYQVHKKLHNIKTIPISKIVVGEFRSEHINHLVNYFSVKDIVLVDDGLASLKFKNYKANQPFYNTVRSTIYKLCFYNIKAINYDFFSIYPTINNKQSLANNYDYIKNHMASKTIEEKVFFIGQPLVELSIVSKEVFEDELYKVIKYYQNKPFVYILHRRQETEYIKNLANKYQFEYVEFDNILEIEMVLSKTIPSDFATFYSSAITTLNILLGKPVFTAFTFPMEATQSNKAMQISLKNCYSEFERTNMPVITL